MSNDLNKCMFIGRLGQDPETRYLPDGKAVTNISLAVGSQWKDQQGQKQERTEWVRGSAFGKLAEIISQYCTKGQQLYVSGEWRTRKWTDQSGTDHYSTELRIQDMQMLGGKGDNQNSNAPAQASQAAPAAAGWDDSENIPF